MYATNVRSQVCVFVVSLSLVGCQASQNEARFRSLGKEIVDQAKTAHEHAAAGRDDVAIAADGQKLVELFQKLPSDVSESLRDARDALGTIGPGFSNVATHLSAEKAHREVARSAKSAAEEKKGDEIAKEFETTAEAELKSAEQERTMADRMIEQLPKQIRAAERLLSPGK